MHVDFILGVRGNITSSNPVFLYWIILACLVIRIVDGVFLKQVLSGMLLCLPLGLGCVVGSHQPRPGILVAILQSRIQCLQFLL